MYQVTTTDDFGDGVQSVTIDSQWNTFMFLIMHCLRKAGEYSDPGNLVTRTKEQDAWLDLADNIRTTRFVATNNLIQPRTRYTFTGPDGAVFEIREER